MRFPPSQSFIEANVNVIYVPLHTEYDPTSFIFKWDYFPSINSAGMRKHWRCEGLDMSVRKRLQHWGFMGNHIEPNGSISLSRKVLTLNTFFIMCIDYRGLMPLTMQHNMEEKFQQVLARIVKV